jgi:GT2 family glycosyltransferase
MQAEFPRTQVVVHERNRGFGKACWSGAQAARHPILILLNSDVQVESDFINPLVDCLTDPTVFAASPLVFDDKGNLSNVTISIPYFRRGKIRYRSFPPQQLLKTSSNLPNPWYTLFPIGAAFAVDRSRFLELQGFDNLFGPFYYEDTDLGFRAWRRGWKCVVVPEARVTHFHTGTIARSFKHLKVSAIRKRNRLFYLWKNLTTARLLRQHFLFQLLRICYRLFCFDGMILVATVLALPKFSVAMQRRREEKRYIVNSEEKIFEIIRSANQANRRVIESTVSS